MTCTECDTLEYGVEPETKAVPTSKQKKKKNQ